MINDSEDSNEKKSALVNVFSQEWKNLEGEKKSFATYTTLFFIAGFIELLTPLVVGLVFNSIQKEIMTTAQLYHIIFLISLLLVIDLVFQIIHGLGRVIEERTGFLVGRNYTNTKISQVLELPIKWHKDHHSGDTIDKINKGRGAITRFSQSYTFQIIYAIINLFGSAIIILFFDFKAAIAALIFSFLVLGIIVIIDKKLNKKYKEINKYENKASAAIFDYISNIITVVTLRLKKTVKKEINKRVIASFQTEKKAAVLNEIKWSFANISITIMTVVILAYRAYSDFNNDGIILIGTLYILYGYLSTMGRTFFTLAHAYGDIVRYDANFKSAEKIDKEFEKIEEKTVTSLPKNWEKITIKGLEFKYDQEGKKRHLENINLEIKKGERIALVGESGSGKSTVLSLIRGLYEPDKGKIYCDRKMISNGFHAIGEITTLIPQDPEIFNNTIKYNVGMDLSNNKQIMKAIKMAEFEKVVKRLDKGLRTNVLEKGVSLSGGEKQRLALARGILAAKDSQIILLDEPTSSVDSINETKIHENLFKKFKGKTIISSIHRLHLLNKFDRIVFFKRGKIITQGTLKELKNNKEFRTIIDKYNNKK
ncbi:MAG: ABC transporter ATP-binding protein [Nanoarchaeota archaeon]